MSEPYKTAFEIGARVRVADRPHLEQFRAEWRFHNPLSVEQLDCAGIESTILEVGFYHGGDPLYELADLPGVWHEQVIEPFSGVDRA